MPTLIELAITRLADWLTLVPSDVIHKVPADLERLGCFWGVYQVIERDLDVPGMVRRLSDGRSVVFLKKDDVSGRKRFSWAHELGHILMADHESPEIGCQKFGRFNRSLERSCNIIATEILMPRHHFVAEAHRLGWSLRSAQPLAATFQVTTQAAARRLVELMDEPALFSVWSPQLGATFQSFKYSWGVASSSGRRLHPQVKWQTGPEAMSPVYQACHSNRVVTGTSKVLLKVDRDNLYKWVETEAMSVGRGNHQSLFALHYLTRAGADDHIGFG